MLEDSAISTSWKLNMLLLWPFIKTGFSKSYTKFRQSAVGVATSITYDRYLSVSQIKTIIQNRNQEQITIITWPNHFNRNSKQSQLVSDLSLVYTSETP